MVKQYKVAEHLFEIEISSGSFLWERMEESYGPFEADGASGETLFKLEVSDNVELAKDNLVYSNRDSVEPGFVTMNIYKDSDGYYFEFTQPSSNLINASLSISSDYSSAKLSLAGSKIEQWLAFNTSVNFCYLLSGTKHRTVLTHASCVIYKGKSWLFLGKSGTGKSTHSRMWLNALEDVTLMNDDHPVIRINGRNEAIAYGSPWSGKTRCYKNLQAPVGGIIRIVRAPYNKARRFGIIESYASLMTSVSGMTWEKELADGRDKTLQGIISSVPCWAMECLPDEDAARVCSQAVTTV